MSKAFKTAEEMASHLSITVVTLREWVRKGYIPASTYIKIGNTYRFNLELVTQAMLAEDDVKNATPAKKEELKEVEECMEDLVDPQHVYFEEPSVDDDY